MSKGFGILINYPKAGIKDMLLKEPMGKYIEYSSLMEVGLKVRDHIDMFKDPTMVCSIVPLDEEGEPGLPIKKYQLVDSVIKEVD